MRGGGTHIHNSLIYSSLILHAVRLSSILPPLPPSTGHGRIRRPFSGYDGPYCTRACMCMFRACLGEPTGRGRGVTCHDMHDALPLASTRAVLICWVREHGRGWQPGLF